MLLFVKHHTKSLLVATLLIVSPIILVTLITFANRTSLGNILGTIFCGGVSPCSNPETPVTVQGFIRINAVNFKVYPEERIPAVGNWDTTADVTLEDCTTTATRSFEDISTNTQGEGTISIPSSVPLPPGDYRFFIHGYSHLNEEFNCYALDGAEPSVDLTLEGKELLAGETSNIYDNFINSLDMSVLVSDLFGSEYLTDLNQDGEVNSLDFSTQIDNIFVTGD